MNFNTVSQACGSLVKMTGTLLSIGKTTIGSNGKPYRSCKIQDANGESHSVNIREGNRGFPPPTAIGSVCQFSVGTYSGRYGLAYSGFFEGPLGAQPSMPAPERRQAQAMPSMPSQDGREASIERQACVKAACERYSGTNASVQDVLALAEALYGFVKSGFVEPAGFPTDEGTSEEELPI